MKFVSPDNWFARKVDLREYTHLEYDWKDLAPQQRNRFLLRIYPRDHRLEHFDFDARNHHAFPEVVRCTTAEENGNAHATIELRHYKVRDSRLIRRIVLFRNGPLILMDQFYLPAHSAPQLVGPVWNYHDQEIDQHDHWFIDQRPERTWYQATKQRKEVDSLRTLVWFLPEQGRASKIVRRLHFGFATTALSQTVAQPGTWTTTACVIHPVSKDQSPDKIANSLAWSRTGEAYELKVGDEIVTFPIATNGNSAN